MIKYSTFGKKSPKLGKIGPIFHWDWFLLIRTHMTSQENPWIWICLIVLALLFTFNWNTKSYTELGSKSLYLYHPLLPWLCIHEIISGCKFKIQRPFILNVTNFFVPLWCRTDMHFKFCRLSFYYAWSSSEILHS